jgi:hypothetical protein
MTALIFESGPVFGLRVAPKTAKPPSQDDRGGFVAHATPGVVPISRILGHTEDAYGVTV